ncbi:MULTISPECIES: hypothetical protein [unclassified Brevundimonas]|nr:MULTISPECIES: hypothetical protein [unclassified Brevundimonas]
MKKYLISAAFALLPSTALAQAAPFEHVGVRVSWNDLPFNPP